MEWQLALLAAAVGYFLGAISFARVIARLVAPDHDITQTEMDVPGSDEKFQMGVVSATTIGMHLGTRYGLLTTVFDMLKAVLPTLAFKLAFPGTHYFLIVAAASMAGHNWPIYHRFKGGRGLSTLYGGFLVADWVGSLVTSFAGMAIGLFVIRDVLISYLVGLWLMIPWLWFRWKEPAYLIYGIVTNLFFVLALVPEIKQYLKFRRMGLGDDLYEVMGVTPMGEHMLKMMNRMGLTKEKSEPTGH